MKKTLVTILVPFVYLACTLSAYAEMVAPCSVSGVTISAKVNLNGSSGTAKVVITKGTMHTVVTTMKLQKCTNGVWTSIRSVSGSTNLSSTFTAIKGESYRVYVECTVTDNTNGYVETITRYSTVKTY